MAASRTPESSRSEDRLLHLLGQQTLRISELEAENRSLRDRLTNAPQEQTPVDESRSKALQEAQHSDIEAYPALSKAYDALHTQNKRCERLLKDVQQKYTKAKDIVIRWQAYAQKLQAKIDHAKSNTRPHHDAHEQQAAVHTPFEPSALPTTMSPIRHHQPQENNALPRTTSSQSTEVEPEPEPISACNADDEELPVFVSERQLKRRRVEPQRSPRIKQEGVSASTPLIIPSDGVYVAPPRRPIEWQTSDLNVVAEQDEPENVPVMKPRLVETVLEASEQTPKQRRTLQPLSNNIRRSAPRSSTNKKEDTPLRSLHSEVTLPRSLPPEVKPLRSLPPEALQLQDFRPNPYYHGPAMTFVEPLKSDTTRTCLPGCTRERCCGGKYRRMIELGGAQVTGKTDREALEEYLGPRYQEIMQSYTEAKRQDLVMQAHAMSFARQTGSSN